MITLKVLATCNGGPACLKAYAHGGGIATASNPILASDLQIAFALSFGTSPTSTQKHAIFQVGVPLLVTHVRPDPAVFLLRPGPGNAGPDQSRDLFRLRRRRHLLNPVLPAGALPGLAPTAGPLGSPPAAAGGSPLPSRCAPAFRTTATDRPPAFGPPSGRIMRSRPMAKRSSRRRFLRSLTSVCPVL